MPIDRSPDATVVTTAGPNQSMIHLARVEGGIVVFDLGWWGADEGIEDGLAELGATPDDVIAVFLTHAHRDHIGGWRTVDHAPFFMAEPEVELFVGEEESEGWIPRWADRLVEPDRPEREEVEIRPFTGDTAVMLGSDTVHAFSVPGHTAGSAAYLFRGTLFVGDAVARNPLTGFRPARRGYSDDADRARRELHRLRERLRDHRVQHVCTAHSECAPADDEFWRELLEG